MKLADKYREQTNEVIETKNEAAMRIAETFINGTIIPQIEDRVDMGNYDILIRNKDFEEAGCNSRVQEVIKLKLEEEGFSINIFNEKFAGMKISWLIGH